MVWYMYMKKWLAIMVLSTVIFVVVGSFIYNAGFNHMSSSGQCAFTFGGGSQCVSSVVASLLLTKDTLPSVFSLILLSLAMTFVIFSLFSLPQVSLYLYRYFEFFLSPYRQQLTRWLSLYEHSPAAL